MNIKEHGQKIITLIENHTKDINNSVVSLIYDMMNEWQFKEKEYQTRIRNVEYENEMLHKHIENLQRDVR